MYPISKYKFHVTPDHKTIAISTYAGKTVRGIAKTDPRDEYDEKFGKELAAARCAVKVAKKRQTRANKMLAKAWSEYDKACAYVDKMKIYVKDADEELKEATMKMSILQDK